MFARRGLDRANHAEVARAAGVSVPTVFVYFPTREALVTAVLDEVARIFLAQARAHHQSRAPAPDVVLAHARAFAATVEAYPEAVRVWLNWSVAVREGDQVWARYLEFQEEVVGLIESTITRGRAEGSLPEDLDAHAAAQIVVGSAHLLAQMKLVRQPEATVERFVEALVRTTLRLPLPN